MAYEGILPKESIDRSKEHWRNELLDFADEITQTFHQELQKARHDWLREEIVKLEGMKRELFVEGPGMTYLNGAIPPHNKCLETIIDRYQSELDQPKQ